MYRLRKRALHTPDGTADSAGSAGGVGAAATTGRFFSCGQSVTSLPAITNERIVGSKSSQYKAEGLHERVQKRGRRVDRKVARALQERGASIASPEDTVVICSNKEMIPLLIAAGYRAVPPPNGDDDIIEKRLPIAAHYVVNVCGNSQSIAEDMAGMGFCDVEQISLSELSCYRVPLGMTKQHAVEAVHSIIGQAEPYVVTILE
jgi:hypothetical protein